MMTMKHTSNLKILLVEDNHVIAGQLYDYLEAQGFIIDYAEDGKLAKNFLEDQHYDVAILDLNLPDMDGLELCRWIKENHATNIPVLMLTARDSQLDKRDGFLAGSDDYLTKPFDFEEVALRCQALARRRDLHAENILNIGELTLDYNRHYVTRAGQKLSLSRTDFDILKHIAQSYPAVISRTDIMRKVWGDDLPDSDVLRSHIYTLRNALDKPFQKPLLKTVHGVGFTLDVENDGD